MLTLRDKIYITSFPAIYRTLVSKGCRKLLCNVMCPKCFAFVKLLTIEIDPKVLTFENGVRAGSRCHFKNVMSTQILLQILGYEDTACIHIF